MLNPAIDKNAVRAECARTAKKVQDASPLYLCLNSLVSNGSQLKALNLCSIMIHLVIWVGLAYITPLFFFC